MNGNPDYEMSEYAIALQHAIEAHCKGRMADETDGGGCPWHAKMLNRYLTRSADVTDTVVDAAHDAFFADYNATHHGIGGNLIAMLHAIADRLESDAERLAEALRTIGERLSSVLCDPSGEVVVHGSDGDRQVLTQALKDLGELAAHSAQAVKALGSLGLTEEQQDAIRFRALCADYGDRAIRAKVRGLIDRLPVMSLSAARSAIDDLTRNIAQPKIGDFDARDSFTVHTNTTTLQQNAAEGAQAQPPAARVPDLLERALRDLAPKESGNG